MATGADKKRAERGSKPRRATKRDMAKRDLRLIEQLAAGVTIEEIAASEGISVQWARERKAAILAKRVVDPPHDFVQLQIRRLSEAMLVAYSAMSNGNLHAVDHVLKIVRELDRHHGFGAHRNQPRLPAPGLARPLLALLEPQARLPAPQSEPTTSEVSG
jgi:hypothetical protein